MTRTSVHIQELALNLTCWKTEIKSSGGKQQFLTTAVVDQWVPAIGETTASSGQSLRAELSLMPPPGSEPTTDPKSKTWPRYRWAIRVRTRIRSRVDYQAEFPVTVIADAATAEPPVVDEAVS